MTQRRKYYFMDYSKLLLLSKKVKAFLDVHRKEGNEFHYQLLGRFLRKKLYSDPKTIRDQQGKIKYLRTSLIDHQALATLRKCFGILQDLGYINGFDFEYLSKQDSYLIHVDFTDLQTSFDQQVKASKYFPREGEPQQLTDENRAFLAKFGVPDYGQIESSIPTGSYEDKAQYLIDTLPPIWREKYRQMTASETNIHAMSRDFNWMFDLQAQIAAPSAEDIIEDRVVVFYGFSKRSEVKRDHTRMAGYLRGVFNWSDKDTDKGHFIGHSLGGGVDENLFPQKKQINRGHSTRGKIFREMESYCADNPGTFCFSRPLYADFSTRPYILEYGILRPDGTLWVEQFDNV